MRLILGSSVGPEAAAKINQRTNPNKAFRKVKASEIEVIYCLRRPSGQVDWAERRAKRMDGPVGFQPEG